MNLTQILARMGEVRDELVTLGNIDGELSAEQDTRWNELNDEFADLDTKRTAFEARAARARELAGLGAFERGSGPDDMPNEDFLGAPGSEGTSPRFKNPWDLSEIRTFTSTPEAVGTDLKARAFAAIEKMPQMTDKRREVLTQFIERFDDDHGTMARQILVTSSPEYLRAFGKLITGRGNLLSPAEQLAVQRSEWAMRAMSTTDAAGGFAIPQQLDPTLILTADGSVNPFRQIARKVVAIRDVYSFTSTGHTSWSYDAEAAQVSDDATTFAGPTITIHKAAGFVPISIEALADIPNVAEEVGRLLALGKDDLEATQFATGSGTAPQGIVTALTGTSSVVASATTDTFAVTDVYNVEEALPAKYRAKGQWTGAKPIYNDIRQFATANDHKVWARLGEGQPARLLDYPAHEASGMDSSITAAADNFVLVLGDWDNYVIADRLGMTVEYIPHLFGTANGRPTGQRGWYAYVRHGADSVNDGAFRMLNVT